MESIGPFIKFVVCFIVAWSAFGFIAWMIAKKILKLEFYTYEQKEDEK